MLKLIYYVGICIILKCGVDYSVLGAELLEIHAMLMGLNMCLIKLVIEIVGKGL